MRITENVDARIRTRDRATSLINEVTAGVVIAGVGALGVFAVVDAVTVPGSSTATANSSTGSASSTTSTSSSSWGLQASSGPISSASAGSGVVVSGGS